MSKVVEISAQMRAADTEYLYGQLVEDTITVKVLKDITFDSFSIRVGCGVRGVNAYALKIILNRKMLGAGAWKAGEVHTFKIEFTPDQYVTYLGENMEIVWFVETDIALSSASKSELRKDYLKQFSLMKVWNPEKEYDRQLKFIVKKRDSKYDILRARHEKKTKFEPKLLFIPPVLVAAAFAFRSDILLVLGMASAVVMLIWAIIRWSGLSKFEHIEVAFANSSDDYKDVTVTLAKNHGKLSYIDAYFEAEEIVVDSSGSSSTTYTESIVKVPKVKQSEIGKITTIAVPLKADNVPSTHSKWDSEVKWFLSLNFVYNGGSKRLRFPVKVTLKD